MPDPVSNRHRGPFTVCVGPSCCLQSLKGVFLAHQWVTAERDGFQAGPCTYTGRTMKDTHDGMCVTAGEFDALVEDLVATLNEFDVPKAEQDELLELLAPMRGEIVEVESPETGAPLPDSYETAPAMT